MTKHGKLQLKYVLNFFHSEAASNIDYNSHKIIDINGEKHVGRVCLVPTVGEQYALFKQSEEIDKFKVMIPYFITPSFTSFFKRRCKCLSKPAM